MAETDEVPNWGVIAALLHEPAAAFLVLGHLVALAAGGFSLPGWTALLLSAAIIARFVTLDRFPGGAIWQRIPGAVR